MTELLWLLGLTLLGALAIVLAALDLRLVSRRLDERLAEIDEPAVIDDDLAARRLDEWFTAVDRIKQDRGNR